MRDDVGNVDVRVSTITYPTADASRNHIMVSLGAGGFDGRAYLTPAQARLMAERLCHAALCVESYVAEEDHGVNCMEVLP